MIKKSIEQRIDRLQAGGIIDLHFDLPMDLYEKRERKKVLETEFLPELEAGNIGVVGRRDLYRGSVSSRRGSACGA